MKLKFKQCYFWACLIFCSIFAVILAPLYLFMALLLGHNIAKAMRLGIYSYGRLFIKLVTPIIPWSVENPDFVVQHKPCIIVPNHQSFLDLYFIGAPKKNDLCLVVRAWPFHRLFFFSPFMKLSQYIETEGPGKLDFMQQCKAMLAQGTNIFCFAEGTRSKDGKLQPFFNGIFRVAIETNTPIVPMLFYNTGKVCPPKSLSIKPGPVIVKMLKPIYPYAVKFCDHPHISLKNKVFQSMQTALELKD